MDYINNLKKEMSNRNVPDTLQIELLKYTEQLLKNNMTIIYNIEHLSKLMGVKLKLLNYYIYKTEDFYKEFSIPKKAGDTRVICAPSLNLKKIQRWILDNLLYQFKINDLSKGFKKNVSILDNAECHTNKRLVYNADIKDFFPSISFKKVYYMFYNVGYTAEVSYGLAKLLTYNNFLPQGAPSSPYISNIILRPLDNSIEKVTNSIGATYTRYADDLTISTNDSELFIKEIQVLKKIIEFHGFELNKYKEHLQYDNQPQFVTGLLVNNGVKVRRSIKKEVEMHIYYCNKFGIFNHLEHRGLENTSFFKEYLYGKVNFIKSIEPNIGNQYLEMLNKLEWSY